MPAWLLSLVFFFFYLYGQKMMAVTHGALFTGVHIPPPPPELHRGVLFPCEDRGGCLSPALHEG